ADIPDATGETRYQQYQLPGGRNYRELLLTLPPPAPREVSERYKIGADIRAQRATFEAAGYSAGGIEIAAAMLDEHGGIETALHLQSTKVGRGFGYTRDDEAALSLLRSIESGLRKELDKAATEA